MANREHVELLMQGAPTWNRWRRRHRDVQPDLSGDELSELESDILSLADAVINETMPGRGAYSDGELTGLDLSRFNLRGCNLRYTNLSRSTLLLADLRDADLRHANLTGCILTSANLSRADLRNASLSGAILRFSNVKNARLDGAMLRLSNLDGVNATRASFRGADLSLASITQADLTQADLSGAFVYGISAWNVCVKRTKQQDLRITRTNEGVITVDDIKIAQFIYTLIDNENVRDAIDTLTTKLVLILGRYTPERKAVLYGVKELCHQHGYVPVLFDFSRPASRDFTETVVTLAHMARFIVADLTDPASIAKELEAIVPRLAVPVQPILQKRAALYAMFSDYWKYDWVLQVLRYEDLPDLRRRFLASIVGPVERKANDLATRMATAESRR